VPLVLIFGIFIHDNKLEKAAQYWMLVKTILEVVQLFSFRYAIGFVGLADIGSKLATAIWVVYLVDIVLVMCWNVAGCVLGVLLIGLGTQGLAITLLVCVGLSVASVFGEIILTKWEGILIAGGY
jgi:hypothetical protein